MIYLQQILMKLVEILLESGPYILLGFLIAGVLHILLPESLFGRVFGRRGVKPLLRSIGLGSLIPICSCGVVPIGLGAYRGGAGTGTVLAFMTAAPTLSPASVLLSLKLLGTELTLWQAGFVAAGSFVMGLIANRWFQGYQATQAAKAQSLVPLELSAAIPSCCSEKPAAVLPAHETKSCCQTEVHLETQPQESRKRPVRELLHWLFVEFGPAVSLDMLLGLLFAATVLTLVPTDWIVLLTGSKTIWSLLLVILVALPVYTCSMAAIPVVFSFLAAGMSPGAAVAFIIAGPATNFGEMNALRAHISWKVALYYFIALLVIAVGAGFVIDHLVQPEVIVSTLAPAGHHHHHSLTGSLLEWFSLLVLSVMMLTEAGKRGRQFLRKRKTLPRQNSPQSIAPHGSRETVSRS